MYCGYCKTYASNGVYECSCCRSNICKDCLIDDKYLLCIPCDEQLRNGKICDKDIYSWLIKCEECGNMWDGNAQCNCWEYDFSLTFESENELTSICSIDNSVSESESENESENMTLSE